MSANTATNREAIELLRTDDSIEAASRRTGRLQDDLRALIAAYLKENATLGNDVTLRVNDDVTIVRDSFGVPHICASNDHDLYFGLGYAQAQDRLWQLDYLRRQAHGRLAEVLGDRGLESDIVSRTLDITSIATRCLETASDETRNVLQAFADGINAWLDYLPGGLPVEFELLGFQPDRWSPVDSFAVQRRWWWYLTGRLGVLWTPEAVRSGLKDERLFDAFFTPDAPISYIVPEGAYDAGRPWPGLPMDAPSPGFGSDVVQPGSNNWVAAPEITERGHALLASDPHVYFSVPADWYEHHLHRDELDVAGVGYPGVPGVLIGRNRHVAWGITNNICSLRDLYIEELDDERKTFFSNGEQRVLETRKHKIAVKDGAPHDLKVAYAHGRPIVDHLVPEALHPRALRESAHEAALSLAWVGFEPSHELQSSLELAKAQNVDEAREAFRSWRCPTWNMVFAANDGAIAYQCIGAIPLRGRQQRGYREASNPDDAWQGTIPFDALPRLDNPARGWISSANNPTAPRDFPYPLSGTWAPEDRAPRAEQLMKTRQPHSVAGFEAMQLDIHSGRVERGLPGLLGALASQSDEHVGHAATLLENWNAELTTDQPGGAIYYVFFWRWHSRVVRERYPGLLNAYVIDSGWGLSGELLHSNVENWFIDDNIRREAIREAFLEALAWLSERLGSDCATWTWGDIHRLGASHPAARTDLQHEFLDIPPSPHAGGASTLAAAFHTPAGTFDTKLGANFRFVTELNADPSARSICWPGQSGQPGSPHYANQVNMHLSGHYRDLSLDFDAVVAQAAHTLLIRPTSA